MIGHWFEQLFYKSKHVCVTVIHHPMCTYRPWVTEQPGVLSWNDLNKEWCQAFCRHLNLTPDIVEARTHIVSGRPM